ncbi:class I SAM-dependent methyltransferase [Mesorhizobium sp.]|uniref:class I SAM-dependent methyltransferase n=1 Tax=Mesorhizobium sp. TaxID=1871066 RepID=UPI0025EA1739|nr:class I SAM-dependent methyltransferase [Mesorhizobium sp.]
MLASSLAPLIPQEKTTTILDEEARLVGLYEARKRSNVAILEVLSRILGANQRALLDVGCGHGLFLKDAQAAGFHAEGVEPDANVVDGARTATGAIVRHGYFPDALGEGERFDAITFNDVLEHIPQVEKAMTACHQHLRPDGVLVLNCPDKDGIFYRLANLMDRLGISGPFLRMWQFGLPSPHVWYFSANHLARLGKKAGFEEAEVIRLAPITAKGLRQRVSYVQGQSNLMNGLTYAGSLALLPLLDLLPRDTSIVFLRKSGSRNG